MTRRGRILLALALLAVAVLLALYWAAQPPRVAALVTSRVGAALGLEITAKGISEYRLRGTPMLVLRDVTVREPGATQTLLTAARIHVALPWSTLRAGGRELTARRIELDAPRLDLSALQRWLATRPPSEARLPTLTDGLRIRDGVIVNPDWSIDGIAMDLPALRAGEPLRARLRGRYLDAPLAVPVDLAVAIVDPEALVKPKPTGFATQGRITIERGRDWRLPATVTLSGPLRLGDDDLRISPARIGMGAVLETGDMRLPFALGLHGPLLFDEATWTLAPAGVALRGRGDEARDPVPDFDARGLLALGRTLTVQLDGNIARWPPAWPALPPPIGQSPSPLPFALRYDGTTDLADAVALHLQREATRFAGKFRLPRMLEWIDLGARGTPLPPLSGTLSTPELEIAGTTLEGVEIEFSDDAVAP